MAYLPVADDDKRRQQAQALITSAPAAASGGGSSAGMAPTQPRQNEPATPGWTNLQDYLSANTDAARSMAYGARNAASTDLARAQQGLNDQASQWQASNQLGIDAWNKDHPGQTFDASSVEAWNPDTSSAKTALSNANALYSDAGRRAWLGKLNANTPGYTPGMSGIDAWLMGGVTPQNMGFWYQTPTPELNYKNPYVLMDTGTALSPAGAPASSGQTPQGGIYPSYEKQPDESIYPSYDKQGPIYPSYDSMEGNGTGTKKKKDQYGAPSYDSSGSGGGYS